MLTPLTFAGRRVRWIAAILMSLQCISGFATELQVARPGYLFWPNAPPNLDPFDGGGGGFLSLDSDQRYLAVQTPDYHLEFDVLNGLVSRFVPAGTAESALSGGQFRFTTQSGEIVVSTFKRKDYPPEFFPVRIIESGPWFQHFAIHDLVLTGDVPAGVEGKLWLEVMAWPDRIRISLRTLDRKLKEKLSALSPEGPYACGIPGFRSSLDGRVQQLNGEKVYIFPELEWRAADGLLGTAKVKARGPAIVVDRDEVEGTVHLTLADLDYKKGETTRLGTPVHSGIGGDYPIRIDNDSHAPAMLDLKIVLPDNRSLTGHSLMLLDETGNQTGIPIQISKNWHIKKLDEFLPYMGTWSHGRVSLMVPPHFRSNYTLKLIQGDFGDFNAASIAQLSLIGWGGNGFWIQAALGSWGETVCLQPGRVLRRTYMTDWRPFKSNAIGGGTYDWPANAGGADIFVYFDKAGDYVPFAGNQHLITSYGPCLARMEFKEVSKDRKVAVSGSWSLPMSHDVARTYLRVRCDFLEDTEFSRFSILQMGADRYNPTHSKTGAFGNSEGILLEHTFKRDLGKEGYLGDAVAFEGKLPWITLYGDPVDPDARIGQAQRIMVIHEWNAIIGGESVPSPQAAFYNSYLHGKDSFQAELVPDPSLTSFKAGDHIEMVVEFVLVPLADDAYYGGSPEMERHLAEYPNQWRMAREISLGNSPLLMIGTDKVVREPLPCIAFVDLAQELRLSGTEALVPLTVTGVPRTGCFLLLNEETAPVELVQEWRLHPDGRLDAVLMLDPSELGASFRIRLQTETD